MQDAQLAELCHTGQMVAGNGKKEGVVCKHERFFVHTIYRISRNDIHDRP